MVWAASVASTRTLGPAAGTHTITHGQIFATNRIIESLPWVDLIILDYSSPPNAQWSALCAPAAACSVPHGSGGNIRLVDALGTVRVVQESDTQLRDYVPQGVLTSPQPNVTFYQEGPNSADAMAPGAVTWKPPPLGGVMMATIGPTTYVGASNSGNWTPSEFAAWEKWCDTHNVVTW